MMKRLEYRCAFRTDVCEEQLKQDIEAARAAAEAAVREGRLVNVSLFRHENMGFLYMEQLDESVSAQKLLAALDRDLKAWPEESGDTFWAPMVNIYYHHIPEEDPDVWEKERTTAQKTRIGRIAFLFPEKLPSYVKHHTAIVEEGLFKGDKYQYISLHENILFSYYEEPRNNVNIRKIEAPSAAIDAWAAVDPESHFDRVKAGGDNFLVLPALFTVDRVDL